MKTKLLTALALVVIGTMTVHLPASQLGTAFTYQGRLSDGVNPATGSYDMQFILNSAPTGSAQVGSPQTKNAVPVTNGLFAVVLDFGPGVFTGEERWLELAVKTNGSAGGYVTLSPRTQITPAPNALYSPTAGTAALANSVAAGSINSAAIAPGAVTAAAIAPGAVSQLGAPDGSPLSAMQVDTNGWLGVGTTTPNAGLNLRSGPEEIAPYAYTMLPGGAGNFENMIGPSSLAYSTNGKILAIGNASYYSGGVTLAGISYNNPYFASSIISGQNSFTNLTDLTYGRPAYIASFAFSDTNLLAFAAPGANSVTLANITNLSAPVWQSTLVDGVNGWNDLARPQSVAISGNVLAIGSQGDKAVTLANISNPGAPTVAGLIKSGVNGFNAVGEVWEVAFSGNLLAIASYSSNAVILADCSNPSAPVPRAILNASSGFTNLMAPVALAFDGQTLAIAARDSYSITLVNVSNPSSPQFLSSVRANTVPGTYFMLAPRDLAFVWSGTNRFLVVISEHDNPLTFINTTDPAKPTAAYTSMTSPGLGNFQPISIAAGPNGTFAVPLWSYATDFEGLIGFCDFRWSERNLVTEGRVGIGTSTPEAALDVSGDFRVQNANYATLAASHITLGWGEANGGNSIAINGGRANGVGSLAGGYGIANNNYAFAYGYKSEASGYGATAIGDQNLASGGSAVALGSSTEASGVFALSAGYQTYAMGRASTALGQNSYAMGEASFAAGYYAWATNDQAVALGRATTAGGVSSLAAGYRARALHNGSFVWGDNTEADLSTTASNQFLIRASGGVGIGGAPEDAALDVEGPARINDHDLYLRRADDRFHGLGWYGQGKLFSGVNLDGPALYGASGGALGTTGSGQRMALSWDNFGNVFIDPTNSNNGGLAPGLRFGGGSGEGIASKRTLGGNQNHLGFYTSFEERLTILNNGRVGIGTTTPSAALEVNGTITASSFSGSFTGSFSGSGAALTGISPTNLVGGNVTSQLNFLASGGLGIGTDSPYDAMLDVEGDIRLNNHNLYFKEWGDRFHGLGWFGLGKLFAGKNVDGPVLFGFSGGGLGCTANGTNLVLNWNASSVVAIDAMGLNNGAVNSGSLVLGGLTSGEGIASKRTAGGNQFGLDFYTFNTNRMAITQTGNVGIGTTSPTHALTISSPTTNTMRLIGPGGLGERATFNFGDANYVYLQEDIDDNLTIYSSGRKALMGGFVGIGKTSPTSMLDVNGTVTATAFSGSHSGNGSGLTLVNADTLDGQDGSYYQNAANLNTGLLSDARLSGNVALLNTGQAFSAEKSFNAGLRMNYSEIYVAMDNLHGLGWYGSGKLFGGVNVNGPVLYGNGGGALGSVGGSANIALQWDAANNVSVNGGISVFGESRLNNKDMVLRAGTDRNHGLGWYGIGKTFGSLSLDGPALYGYSGGVLGIMNSGTSTNAVLYWNSAGNVGIGTTSPTTRLSVNGGANNTTGTWGVFSDERLKENIAPIPAGSLDRLMALKGVTYEYNRPELREGYQGIHRGWIAQEVETVFPEWVSEAQDGMKMVTPVGFNALTVEALRELRAEKDMQLKARDAEIADLKQTVNELKELVKAMDRKFTEATK